MTLPFVATKCFIPEAHPDVIVRKRLFRCLEEGLQPGKRVILLSASAGYGKTTLVSEWLRTLTLQAGPSKPVQAGWLSIDPNDHDPARF